jgi:hypothetical protein
MKNELTAAEAAEIVGKSAKHFRATLRVMKADGDLDPEGAWQEPAKPNGSWKIRRVYLTVLAADRGWTVEQS